VGYCSVNTAGLTCSIAQTKTFTYTVTGSFGATPAAISSTLGISVSESIAVIATCASPNINPGRFFYAYPTQTQYTYRVHKHVPQYRDPDAGIDQQEHDEDSPVAYVNVYDGGVSCELK
jgi:hypothetical protein